MLKVYSIQLPTSAFSALRKDPDDFLREMKLAAAVKWYELGEISQEKAAEIAGVSRFEFIKILERFKVSAIQYTEESLDWELKNACR
jgi:predicted HTH domain antitoxin